MKHRITQLIRLLLLLFVMSACQSSRTIINGLKERDANEILVLLAQNKITAYKTQEKTTAGGGGPKIVLWDISVDAGDATKAMSILSMNGLPRKMSPNLIDLFNASGLVPSDMAEKIRYQAGLSDTIANMIRKMDGVVDADVRLSFPEEDPLNPNAPKGQITASVYVKHTGILDDPNSHLVSKIKQLVSSAVSGLTYDNVTVVPDRARFAISSSIYNESNKGAYVPFMGFVIAKSSITSFKIFFWITVLVLLLLVAGVALVVWKITPLLQRRGGIKELFRLTPLADVELPPAEKPPVEK